MQPRCQRFLVAYKLRLAHGAKPLRPLRAVEGPRLHVDSRPNVVACAPANPNPARHFRSDDSRNEYSQPEPIGCRGTHRCRRYRPGSRGAARRSAAARPLGAPRGDESGCQNGQSSPIFTQLVHKQIEECRGTCNHFRHRNFGSRSLPARRVVPQVMVRVDNRQLRLEHGLRQRRRHPRLSHVPDSVFRKQKIQFEM